MVEWLKSILQRFGLRSIGISVSVPLPSFYKVEDDMKQSEPGDMDAEDVAGITTSRDFKLCHPELVKRFSRLSTAYAERNPGKSLIVTCTYRSPDEQARLYSLGRRGNEIIDSSKVVTNINGATKISNHNRYPARAMDVAIVNGGKVTWIEKEYYPLGVLANEFDLVWGGHWVTFQDLPHLELPKDVV